MPCSLIEARPVGCSFVGNQFVVCVSDAATYCAVVADDQLFASRLPLGEPPPVHLSYNAAAAGAQVVGAKTAAESYEPGCMLLDIAAADIPCRGQQLTDFKTTLTAEVAVALGVPASRYVHNIGSPSGFGSHC